jgi:hypothetical protein
VKTPDPRRQGESWDEFLKRQDRAGNIIEREVCAECGEPALNMETHVCRRKSQKT